jgi:CHAD domain-containing protein
VLIERLRGRAAAFDNASRAAVETLIEVLVADRETARAEMLGALGSNRYTTMLRRLAAAVSKPLPITASSAADLALVELVRTEYRRMCKAVHRAGDDPPDKVLPALRIHGKRLRYTSELAAAGRKQVRRLVTSTVAFQDLLGEHQDACVAQYRVRQLLDGLGDVVDFDVVFAAGRLVEREEASRVATRQAWPAAWQLVQYRAQALDPLP